MDENENTQAPVEATETPAEEATTAMPEATPAGEGEAAPEAPAAEEATA